MYLAVIFVVLFRISFGLIQHSELDNDLNDRNAVFYDVKNARELKRINTDEAVQKEQISINFLKTDVRSKNLTTSKDFHNSIVEDPSNDMTETETIVLHDDILEDTLKTVGGEADNILNNKSWEDFLDIIDEKVGTSLPGEPLVRKIRAAKHDMKKECMKKMKEKSDSGAKIIVGKSEPDEKNRCSCKSVATSFPRVPAVFIFVNTVIKNIQSSELLTSVFNITDGTPQQYSQLKYRYIADFLRRYGFVDANVIADFSLRHVAKYFDVIPPQALIQVTANYMADALFADGTLTIDNAEDLALKYYKKLEESAKIQKIDGESGYTPKFIALINGETSFLQSYGKLSYSKTWRLAVYYAHEWLLAAVKYGTLRYFNS